jgi:CBS domain-containing protein
MLAKDVMTSSIVSVTPETTVSEIAKLLIDRGISGVPVLEADGSLAGVVSEGDLIRRAEIGTEGRRSWWLDLLTGESEKARDYVKSHGRHARDIMTKDVVTVAETTPLSDIATLLEERRIKRVPVVRDGKVVGIVSRSNLLQGLAFALPGPAASDATDVRGRVIAELDGLSWLHPTQLNVIVSDGVVEIWGYVDSGEQKQALTVAIENVEGVTEIRDHVGVMPHYLAGV